MSEENKRLERFYEEFVNAGDCEAAESFISEDCVFYFGGARGRSELVGQVFMEHYVSRFEDLSNLPSGWLGKELATADVLTPH